jgi:hypothetical protein
MFGEAASIGRAREYVNGQFAKLANGGTERRLAGYGRPPGESRLRKRRTSSDALRPRLSRT